MAIKRQHQQQHKEESEEKKKVRALAELKRENQRLRKQLSRTEKHLTKALKEEVLQDEEAAPEAPRVPERSADSCPECASVDIVNVTTPVGTLKGCKECGWRTNARKPA